MIEPLTESPLSPPSTPGPYRVDDYLALPDEPRCELIYGRFYMAAAPIVLHQIVVITLAGIVIGGLITLGLSLLFPPTIPLSFSLRTGLTTILTILAVGPIGGLVAIRYSLRIEPLTALGLDS